MMADQPNITAIERALVPLRNILGAVDGVMAEWADGEAGAELVPATIGQWAEEAIRELATAVEETKARERLLVIASDYLSQHWDMDSAPLNEIAEAATQSDQEGEGGD